MTATHIELQPTGLRIGKTKTPENPALESVPTPFGSGREALIYLPPIRHSRDPKGPREFPASFVRNIGDKEPRVARAVESSKEEGFEDHGSLEGHLEMATRGGRARFDVYEPIWDRPIRCHVGDDLLEEAAGYFGRRVEVYGMIRYREDGTPVSILAEEIAPFPDADGLPGFREVKGILKGYAHETTESLLGL